MSERPNPRPISYEDVELLECLKQSRDFILGLYRECCDDIDLRVANGARFEADVDMERLAAALSVQERNAEAKRGSDWMPDAPVLAG